MDERNHRAAIVFTCIGFLVGVLGFLAFLLDRESWQAVMTLIGFGVMGFGVFADE